jgi:hypothetical protein
VHLIYSATSASINAASVAKAALNDLSHEKTDLYANEYNGKYSPYTAAERKKLSAYVG